MLNEAIVYFKNYLFQFCVEHNIMVTYHHVLNNEGIRNSQGEFIIHYNNKNEKFYEIRLLNYYSDQLREIFIFSHELGHYFAHIKFLGLSEEEEEIYCNKIFLDLLMTMPEWVIMSLREFVFDYKVLDQEFNCTAIYMQLFNVKLENIEKSYVENRRVY